MLEACFIKKLPEFTVLVDIKVEGETLVLSGASGSGKTTTLECLSGIQKPDSGLIKLNGRILYSSREGINMHPSKRSIGYIFQDYALFQHMNVSDNILYGCKLDKKDRVRTEAFQRVTEMLHISNLLDRYPAQLSGGEKQRVAMARGLLSSPELMLLDEPLSALDKDLRHQVRTQLDEIQQTWQIAFIMVSHCDREARRGKTVISAKRTVNPEGEKIVFFEKNNDVNKTIDQDRLETVLQRL